MENEFKSKSPQALPIVFFRFNRAIRMGGLCFIAAALMALSGCKSLDKKTGSRDSVSLEVDSVGSLPRVIVSTDIGGSDPDDFQSFVHYLHYADRFDTEGLVSSPPHGGRAAQLFEGIDAYGKDFENLNTIGKFPPPDFLRSIVRQGAIDAQEGPSPKGLSEGAKLIIERAKFPDARPLYILVWGSITDLAQALHADPSIVSKVRVYSIGSWNTREDPAARDYIYSNFPSLWWIESNSTFRGMYIGGVQDAPYGNVTFPEAYLKGRGALGDLFMEKKADIKMGDTPSVLYLLHGDPDDPEAPHWGGRFVKAEASTRPFYWTDDPDPEFTSADRPGAKTVSIWRKDFLDDWIRRLEVFKGSVR